MLEGYLPMVTKTSHDALPWLCGSQGTQRGDCEQDRRCPALLDNRVRMVRAQNLYEIVSVMRHFGVGSSFSRTIWKFPECYWRLTR